MDTRRTVQPGIWRSEERSGRGFPGPTAGCWAPGRDDLPGWHSSVARGHPKGADLKEAGAAPRDGLPCLLDPNCSGRFQKLRLGNSIPAKLLSAGSAMLLVCGIASAQSSNKSAGVNRPSRARFLTVSSSSTSRKNRKSRKRVSSRQRGQQKIDPARAREIQEALIREHYMEGSASGVWDANFAECDGTLPGGQWLAEQSRSRFPGIDQTGTRAGPRTPSESGKRDDIAAPTSPRFTHAESDPDRRASFPEIATQFSTMGRPSGTVACCQSHFNSESERIHEETAAAR